MLGEWNDRLAKSFLLTANHLKMGELAVRSLSFRRTLFDQSDVYV